MVVYKPQITYYKTAVLPTCIKQQNRTESQPTANAWPKLNFSPYFTLSQTDRKQQIIMQYSKKEKQIACCTIFCDLTEIFAIFLRQNQ